LSSNKTAKTFAKVSSAFIQGSKIKMKNKSKFEKNLNHKKNFEQFCNISNKKQNLKINQILIKNWPKTN
jgi:hypothetical protein